MPRFGAFFVLKGTAFRWYILEPVPDVPLVRLWGSIGTRIPIWVYRSVQMYQKMHILQRMAFPGRSKTLAERKTIIAGMKRCTNCFSLRHENKDCTSNRSCYKCDGRHHQTLCSKKITRFAEKGATGPSSSTATGSSAVVTTACNSAFGEVILKTATVWLIGPDGKETKTILFLTDEATELGY